MTKSELKEVIKECVDEIIEEKSNYDKVLSIGKEYMKRSKVFRDAGFNNRADKYTNKAEEILRNSEDRYGNHSYVDPYKIEEVKNKIKNNDDIEYNRSSLHNTREKWKSQHGNVGQDPRDKKPGKYLDMQNKLREAVDILDELMNE